VALQAARGFRQEVLVVRPFNHIGPGQSPAFAVSAFAKRIVEAERSGATSLLVGNLATRRDFTDVRDVVAAYRRLAEDGRPGETTNVCSGEDVAMAEVVELLLERSGRSIELVVDPSLLRPVDVPVLRGSAEFCYQTTGWEPSISLRQTIDDVLADWRARP
jgi:GDP-4-dehydro-6-deoxy-D-mannose reductase